MNKKQLTVRGLIIGAIGSIVLTCSSMFIALKISSLPWPIMFVVLVSMFCLKLLGNTNLQEINVTQTAMSAGAMVAGGLAFTIPGIWMIHPDADVSISRLMIVTLGGVVLGLIFTALFRKYFIETKELPYAMGEAAAVTLQVGDKDKKKAGLLFGSMGIAGIFTFFRDAKSLIPSVSLSQKMMPYGSMCGIWYSPMLISIGYIIGPVVIGVWFLGALIGDFGILLGGTELGLWDSVTAGNIKSSLGIGLMVGTGLGILVKGIIPKAKDIFGSMFSRTQLGDSFINMTWAPFVMVAVAFVFTIWADMGIVASVITILGAWLATSMSAQCVGQSGINPMEIFGIIILLAAKACCSGLGDVEAFYVAAVVAIACGLVGDVMNDFKAGHILQSDPKAQWIAEVVGAVIGGFVSVIILAVILKAYGAEAFGSEMFPAAQASAVAAMVGGISHIPAFIIGLAVGTVLYCINFPSVTLGLGVYLPFYLSATAFVGGLIRFIVDKTAPNFEKDSKGTIIASGLLGGESIVGVIIAIVMAIQIIV